MAIIAGSARAKLVHRKNGYARDLISVTKLTTELSICTLYYLPMLPRHLRRTIPHTAFRLTTTPCHLHPPLAALRYRPATGSVAPFHSTSRRSDELPKSPFQTFVDVLRDELRKNRELQENVKQLQGDVDKFQDSEAMRKARAAYERARVRVIPYSFLFCPTAFAKPTD